MIHRTKKHFTIKTIHVTTIDLNLNLAISIYAYRSHTNTPTLKLSLSKWIHANLNNILEFPLRCERSVGAIRNAAGYKLLNVHVSRVKRCVHKQLRCSEKLRYVGQN